MKTLTYIAMLLLVVSASAREMTVSNVSPHSLTITVTYDVVHNYELELSLSPLSNYTWHVPSEIVSVGVVASGGGTGLITDIPEGDLLFTWKGSLSGVPVDYISEPLEYFMYGFGTMASLMIAGIGLGLLNLARRPSGTPL